MIEIPATFNKRLAHWRDSGLARTIMLMPRHLLSTSVIPKAVKILVSGPQAFLGDFHLLHLYQMARATAAGHYTTWSFMKDIISNGLLEVVYNYGEVISRGSSPFTNQGRTSAAHAVCWHLGLPPLLHFSLNASTPL